MTFDIGEASMKIAVCDDNSVFLQELSGWLNQYSEENRCYIEYKLFTNPLELVAQIEKGVHYDVLFLDVFMPGINGIECAKDIRTYDNYVKIIFLTFSAEFAVESYAVKAYQYLLKPIQKEQLFATLRQLEKESVHMNKKLFVLKSKTGITKISLSQLEYCEVVNRKILLHLVNEEECECGLRMSELEEKLEEFGMFIRPHRSYLINMDYIQSLTSNCIIMESGVKIPIPREKNAQIKQMYMDYIFYQANPVILGKLDEER